MLFQQRIEDTINNHKNKIQLIQWAIISGVSSLVYSEYISKITQKQIPTRKIFVPSIREVQRVLDQDGEFMKNISENLITSMIENDMFIKYIDAPEFVLFKGNDVEVLKTILDLYIIPNMYKRIPETIAKKFRIGDDSNQLFYETKEACLFNMNPISDSQFRFLVDEIILQLLLLIPTMKKDIELPENNINIHITEEEILTIDNDNALCPIHFNSSIIKNNEVIELLKFITSTTIERIDCGVNVAVKNDSVVKYLVKTGIFNQVMITKLNGIENP